MTYRILFVDAYDSFTNNIISLLEISLHVEVTVVKIDDKILDLPLYLKPFSAVIAGPGPGSPTNTLDVGLTQELWKLKDTGILPVLGICLGFQSLVIAFGGIVQPLASPRHGIERRIYCKKPQRDEETIFGDINEFVSVQYHSLYASLSHRNKEDPSKIDRYWDSTPDCPDLEPLAWDLSADNINDDVSSSRSRNPSRILMAVKHRYKPFYGIQFHPESICSDADARRVITLWWNTVTNWHQVHKHAFRVHCTQVSLKSVSKSHVLENKDSTLHSSHSLSNNLTIGSIDTPKSSTSAGSSFTLSPSIVSSPTTSSSSQSACSSPTYTPTKIEEEIYNTSIEQKSSTLGSLTVPIICKMLDLAKEEVIILDSEVRRMPELATHSIIGIVSSDTLRLEYSIDSRHVRLLQNGITTMEDLQPYGRSVFSYLKWFMQARKVICSHVEVPFWGGLMGYINYEACLETIDVCFPERKHNDRPDLSFAFVERSIVIDHEHQLLYVQSIKPEDRVWIDSIYQSLVHDSWIQHSHIDYPKSRNQMEATLKDYLSSEVDIQMPSESSYKAKIRACQNFISTGDSYELCLTNQVSIRVKSHLSSISWPLYLHLRQLNPAPFGAYVRLGALTLLSTSPERFMCWSRPVRTDDSNMTSICQFRPIKGTVAKHQKTANGKLRTLNLAEATSLLSTTKERAENLMIVDLIRHDLHGVVGSGNVIVEKLMVVEEYASVFQLVSVVQGTLKSRPTPIPLGIPRTYEAKEEKNKKEIKTGIDILAASLPPGSMTGAPKRRSCELLHTVEDGQPRSIYSGVVGYMCVGGRGDFSVVIRSLYRWDSPGREEDGGQQRGKREDEWCIGAGGAITALSDEEGEWEEMKIKLMSTIGVFRET